VVNLLHIFFQLEQISAISIKLLVNSVLKKLKIRKWKPKKKRLSQKSSASFIILKFGEEHHIV